MDNPKFQEGDLSTNFIPEQYAGGFNGIDLAVMNVRMLFTPFTDAIRTNTNS